MNEKTIQNWLAIAQYDLETAKAMLKSGRYLYVAYTCQQSIEKIIKAIYVQEKKTTPPYTHNLRRLISELLVLNSLTEKQLNIIDIINSFYLESRYSEEIEQLANNINKTKATEIYINTKELFQWLKTKII